MSEIKFTGTALPKAIAIFDKDWDLVGGSLFDEMQAMRKITTRPDYQRVIEKIEGLIAEPVGKYENGHNHGLRDAIAILKAEAGEPAKLPADFGRFQGNDDN